VADGGFNKKRKEQSMNYLRNTTIALMAIGGAALIGFVASAQTADRYDGAPYSGSYYTYGAERANPSLSPHGWDQDNPRDFQFQGSR